MLCVAERMRKRCKSKVSRGAHQLALRAGRPTPVEPAVRARTDGLCQEAVHGRQLPRVLPFKQASCLPQPAQHSPHLLAALRTASGPEQQLQALPAPQFAGVPGPQSLQGAGGCRTAGRSASS